MIKKNLNLSLFIFGIIVIGIIFLLSQHKPSLAQQTAFKTFDSKVANFEIKYPGNWKERGDQKITDEPFRLFGKRAESFIILESPQKTINPPLPSEAELGRKLTKEEKQALTSDPQAFFNIYVSNTTKHLNTDTMTVKPASALTEFTNFKQIFNTDPWYQNREIKEGNLLLNDSKTQAYTFEQIRSSKDNKDWQYIIHVFFNSPDDSKTFELEYGADVLKIPDYLPIFKTMISSFKFINT